MYSLVHVKMDDIKSEGNLAKILIDIAKNLNARWYRDTGKRVPLVNLRYGIGIGRRNSYHYVLQSTTSPHNHNFT